ncbi:AAA family ATPase [Amphritea balenae]|uniref:AAA+ ATPase domain-containing protein n=1 Tax=Amphritea balenae TaxID=452629 RepID=A0A3P1SS41_9GAMM|nr:AAA family ATPase [Amphritea balenae]RRC99724.1 hypothetical protein EHS89_09555 [Amphritea balenae]GGK79321.1 hypothetical protein GCM10007941_31970 [Amphritea balenae]
MNENYISKVVIDGFWGDRSLVLDFNQDVNFLIGVNGSGKTTVINLIAAALMADFTTLDRIEFEKISIVLKGYKKRKKPEVVVLKKYTEGSPFGSIEYRIKNSAGEPAVGYSLDDFEEHKLYRDIPKRYVNRELKRIYGDSIVEHLESLTQISWLSVHRASPSEDRERKSFESTVDRKLDELMNRLVRYFSSLGRNASGLLEKFQESVFLSMLVGRKQGNLFRPNAALDLEEEKDTLYSIFNHFNLDVGNYKSRVDNHFVKLDKAMNKVNEKEGLDYIDVASIVLNDRIDQIIEDWKIVTQKRSDILQPRETFLKIINGLVQRKTFFINDRNELEVETDSNKKLLLKHLSSGEKQLLIVLGEALLQENRSCVYIADEPELSLHVSWQERLVDNLRALNPHAQIIFATHSPDVVSSYGNKVFDMEEYLNVLHKN